MSFTCPSCQSSYTLKIEEQIEIPSDRDWDEISLQVVVCTRCGFSGLAAYRETRRGPLNRETIHHFGYRTPRRVVQEVQRAIRKCPNPRSPGCPCSTHQRLGTHTANHQWDPPFFLNPATQFPMIISRTGAS